MFLYIPPPETERANGGGIRDGGVEPERAVLFCEEAFRFEHVGFGIYASKNIRWKGVGTWTLKGEDAYSS